MQRSDESSGGVIELGILLVEDNPGDVVLFKQTLRNSSILHSLSVAKDGAQAIEMLKARNGLDVSYRPDVVFLDLNLPCKTGAEVLAEMKADPVLASIPVAILTGSDHEDDFAVCTALGVNAYFHKALALQDFRALASAIQAFLRDLASRQIAGLFSEITVISAA